jgi:hypothetical protein
MFNSFRTGAFLAICTFCTSAYGGFVLNRNYNQYGYSIAGVTAGTVLLGFSARRMFYKDPSLKQIAPFAIFLNARTLLPLAYVVGFASGCMFPLTIRTIQVLLNNIINFF